MLSIKDIQEVLEEKDAIWDFKIYNGEKGTGIIYKTIIKEIGIMVERVKTFQNIEELRNFIELFKSRAKIEIQDYQSIEPEIRFIKNEKEYTVDMMRAEKEAEENKRKERLKEKCKELKKLNDYLRRKEFGKDDKVTEEDNEQSLNIEEYINLLDQLQNENSELLLQAKRKDLSGEQRSIEQLKYDIFSEEYFDRRVQFLEQYDLQKTDEEKLAFLEKYKEEQEKERNERQQLFEEPKQVKHDVYENLEKQFDKNLTPKEKEAVLIYNSSLFLFINAITSMENYKQLSKKEIIENLKEDENWNGMKRTLYNLAKCVTQNENDVSVIFKRILTSNDIIGELLKYIDIIENMKTKIVLPEDVVLYRGIYSNQPITDGKPNKGKFMSTSLDVNIAKKFSKDGKLIKIFLKKGTPVTTICPYIVMRTENLDKIYTVRDSENELPQKEIILNMDNFKIANLNKKIVENYEFYNGEAEKRSPYYIYEYELELTPEMEDLMNSQKEISGATDDGR